MRRRFTEVDRQRFYAELERSGDSSWQVARRMGLNPSTAYRWVAGRESGAPVFAQVVRSQPEAQGTGIALEVSGVRVVVERGFDAKVLREIVDALTDGDS